MSDEILDARRCLQVRQMKFALRAEQALKGALQDGAQRGLSAIDPLPHRPGVR